MKYTNEMIEKVNAIIEEDFTCEYFGIRVQDVPFEIGPMNHQSSVWVDGEETSEMLDGVCVTSVDMVKHIDGEYFGDYVALIGGNNVEYGEDVGELIIIDPVVLAILTK